MRVISIAPGFPAALIAALTCFPAQAQVELNPVGCSQEPALRAVSSDTPAAIRFVNATSETVKAYRLDSAGKRVFDSSLAPSGTSVKKTFLTHPWVITNAADQCAAIYLPVAGEATARIATLSIILAQTGLMFQAVAGGPAPLPQTFSIMNGGSGVMDWTLSIPMMTGEMIRGWVRVSPNSGSTDPAQPAPTVEARVDPSGLPPGEYCNLVQVSARGAINSPQSFCVVLLVLPADANPGPVVEPAALLFVGPPGGGNPAPQTLRVSNMTSRPLTLSSTAAFGGGANWFSYQPAGGAVAPGAPVTVTVQPNLSALPPGTYGGELTFGFAEGGPSAKIGLQAVAPSRAAGSSAKATRDAGAQQAQCTPTKLLPVFTGLASNFNLQAGWPIPIEVLVVDDCNSAMTTGSAVTSFSNEDPPVYLTSLSLGRWSGTWPARNARPAGMTITVRAQQPEKRIEGTVQISGGLQGAPDVPVVAAGGVVSAASYAGAPPSPGSFVAIFGERLSEGPGVATQLPLQTRMQGTEVFVSGRTIPLLYTSSGQVNAMIPYNVVVNGRHQLIVRRGHCMSVPEPLEVAPAQPAVFTADGTGKGQGHIYRVTAAGEQILAASSAPATAGDVLVMYAAGLGLVDPPVEAGTAAPATVLTKALNDVTVTIGDKQAAILFAGLTPGFTGLYQVNAMVPEGVTAGDQVPVVLTVAGRSSPPVTIAVR